MKGLRSELDFSNYFESTRFSASNTIIRKRAASLLINEISRELSAGLSTLSTTVFLTRHHRNFNSIKSPQISRDSDHGEYLFLPDDFGQRQPEPYSSGLFSSRPPFSVFRRERRKGGRETIIGEVGNYRITPLAFAAV